MRELKHREYVKFKVLTAVLLRNQVFGDVMLCGAEWFLAFQRIATVPSNHWGHLPKNTVSLSRRHETSIQIKCILHVVGANTAHLYAWCIIFMLLENVRNRYVPQTQDTDCRIHSV
jgi:hypothetical protein